MTSLGEVANDVAGVWAGGMWAAVWQSAVLALGVFLLTLCLRRGPSSLRFWLWMLVPLRLLVMPMFTIPLPLMPAPEPDREVYVAPAMAYGTGFSEVPMAFAHGAPAAADAAEAPVEKVAAVRQMPVVPEGVRLSAFAWMMAAWALGATVCAIRMAWCWRRTKAVIAGGVDVTSGPLFDLARRAACLIGTERVPRLVVTKERTSPFACGIRHPVVVLPRQLVETVDQAGLLAVLTHEFAHLRRRDSLSGLVMAACESVYFFHPVVHFAKRRILLERERACDDFVLATSKAKPSAYARALVKAAEMWRVPDVPMGPAAVVSESFSDLRERLLAMACNLRPAARLSAGAVVFLVLLAALCVPGIALTARKPAMAVEDGRADAALVELSEPTASSVALAPVLGAKGDLSPKDGLRAAEDPGSKPPPASSAGTRTIHFPSDRSMGTLSIFTQPSPRRYRLGPEYNALAEWRHFSQAKGDVVVPEGARVRLVVAHAAKHDLSPLSELDPDDLYGLHISCPEGMDADRSIMPYLSGLTGLRELSLYKCNISGIGARHIANLRKLEYLWISAERLDGAVLTHFGGLTSLEVLALQAAVTDRELRQLTTLTSLRELALSVPLLHGPGLENLSLLPSLEFLILQGNGFSDDGLRYLKDLTSLKSLRLFGGLQITDAGLPHLSQLTGLEELRFVWLDQITDAGMVHLAPLQKLKLLDLHSTKVTDAGIATLTALTSLEDLTFPARGPGDVSLEHVAKLSRLRRLNARGFCPADQTKPGPFTDEGLRHLTKLRDLEEFQMCSGIGVTDVGMGYLAQLPRLKHVSLLVNGVTNDGLAKLATVKSLTNLWLSCRGVSVAGVNHLNALDNLEFLSMLSVLRDDSTLDLSGLTKLENLALHISDRYGRDSEGALRDEDLACLADLTQLRWMQVGFSPKLTDAGMAHLAKLDELDRVSIGGKHVTDAGLQYLTGKQAMNMLSVRGDFTSEGLRQLEGLNALAHLTIDTKEDLSMAAVARLQAAMPNLVMFNGALCQ
jgi:beta-lactamase regulating signal transducer with metallopeptidase domain